MLHHVSQGFYVAWLDDPLPEESFARYAVASQRLGDTINDIEKIDDARDMIWLAAGARVVPPDQIISQLISTEMMLNGMNEFA